MKRAIIALASIALLAACSSSRKACRRAEGMIQKAVRICPEAAQLRTDTVVITVPGDSVTLEAAYIQPDRDSLRAVIAQLSEALDAERQLATVDIASAKARTRRSLDRVRKNVCWFEPMTIESETARGIISVDSAGQVHAKCWCKPQRRTAEVTRQNVIAGKVEVHGGIPWWMWLLVALLCLTSIGLYLLMDHWRYKYHHDHDQ
jgi:hypothetical protein